MNASLLRNPKLVTAALVALGLGAALSLAQGAKTAIESSGDFQWSPSRLLAEGVNPYEYYLQHGKGGLLILNQAPNYLHAIYVLLYPLGQMEWVSAKIAWAVINLSLSAAVLVVFIRAARLSRRAGFVVATFFLCSFPERLVIGNGQLSLFCLFFASFLLYETRASAVWLGLSYMKYSFAPPLAAYLLFKQGPWRFLLSLVFATLGFVAFLLMQPTHDLITLIAEPLRVNLVATPIGAADWMSLAQFFQRKQSGGMLWLISVYAVPAAASLAAGYYYAHRSGDRLIVFSALSVVSLLTFKHMFYDFVFLLPAFAACAARPDHPASRLGFACVVYFWLFLRALAVLPSIAVRWPLWLHGVNFVVLCLLLVAIERLRRESERSITASAA